ncbi:Glycine/D-amino acid oxidase [Microbacterium sp. cf046]|uniref:NAD(P)/FAD-dependent oxidoreductase n=1 Tax=Microbacterium sp. cf046 TaxID=1761803 RepID=UPI0008E5E5B0|nr:FAD-binding oxidoreductase [Microbacterium sp. cf046]SFR99290.1 Glycine/D-amino acid oxidase [Microbacterium sp. cf046]
MTVRRVAVLGAGIMGSSLAIDLARRGVDVTLIDREAAPMQAASRWNEGKIHLGYLYAADPTTATAEHILPGSLRFADRARELIGEGLDGHVTQDDDIYLLHRDSVVSPDAMRRKFETLSDLIHRHPDASRYLVDVSAARVMEIDQSELREMAGDDIVAGFRVPERSVDTQWFADRLAGAVAAETHVVQRLGTTVVAAHPRDDPDGRWVVRDERGDEDDFDVVINALWAGRLPIDVTAGVIPQPPWSHRFRLCVFLRTRSRHDLPSALVSVGPFGDVKNYNGRDFYLSWYPAGLVAEGGELELQAPPLPVGADAEIFMARVRASLERLLPGVGAVFDDAESAQVHGGFVFARATGRLEDPGAGLHRRNLYGVERRGSYHSVDTGKYSTAPWTSAALAAEIAG